MLKIGELKRFKNALVEELNDCKFEKKRILLSLKKLPKGSLQKRNINGRDYYYLVFREGGKVKTKYIGKKLPTEFEDKYIPKETKSKNKQLVTKLNKKIGLLEKCIKSIDSLASIEV